MVDTIEQLIKNNLKQQTLPIISDDIVRSCQKDEWGSIMVSGTECVGLKLTTAASCDNVLSCK